MMTDKHPGRERKTRLMGVRAGTRGPGEDLITPIHSQSSPNNKQCKEVPRRSSQTSRCDSLKQQNLLEYPIPPTPPPLSQKLNEIRWWQNDQIVGAVSRNDNFDNACDLGTSSVHNPISVMRGSRTKSAGPKGRLLEVGAQRDPRLATA